MYVCMYVCMYVFVYAPVAVGVAVGNTRSLNMTFRSVFEQALGFETLITALYFPVTLASRLTRFLESSSLR
jgi:hypothetical protein